MRVKGTFISEMSGKLGGIVASHTGGTQYFRKLTKPNNPKTAAQTTVRNNFTTNSQAWRSLTATELAAWRNAVINFPSKNKIGGTSALHGNNLYQRLNNNLLNIGASVISTPPLPTAVDALTSLSLAFSATAGTSTVTFAPTPVPSGYALVLEGTAPTSAGKSNLNNKYRKIAVVAAAAASPYNWYSAYVAKFGAAAVGQLITVRAKLVSTTTGLESQHLIASTLAV